MTADSMRDELVDQILPAQSVYSQEVVAAELAYRDAVNEAWKTRKQRIDRALATCLEAIRSQSPDGAS